MDIIVKENGTYLCGEKGDMPISEKEAKKLEEFKEKAQKYDEIAEKIIFLDSQDKELTILGVKNMIKDSQYELINSIFNNATKKTKNEKNYEETLIESCLKRILINMNCKPEEAILPTECKSESANRRIDMVLEKISIKMMESIKELEKNNDEETNNRCLGKLFAYADEFDYILSLFKR